MIFVCTASICPPYAHAAGAAVYIGRKQQEHGSCRQVVIVLLAAPRRAVTPEAHRLFGTTIPPCKGEDSSMSWLVWSLSFGVPGGNFLQAGVLTWCTRDILSRCTLSACGNCPVAVSVHAAVLQADWAELVLRFVMMHDSSALGIYGLAVSCCCYAQTI